VQRRQQIAEIRIQNRVLDAHQRRVVRSVDRVQHGIERDVDGKVRGVDGLVAFEEGREPLSVRYDEAVVRQDGELGIVQLQ
jgi:hypothetical protein